MKLNSYKLDSGSFITPSADVWINKSLKKYGHWEKEIVDLVIQHTNKESYVIEVGSHIGLHTVPIARHVKWVYSFEMQRRIAQILNTNLVCNDIPNVTVYNEACSNENDIINLAEINYDFHNEAEINTGNVHLDYIKENANYISPINIVKLDDKLKNIRGLHLIKCDAETHDDKVLEGAQNLIKKFKPVILTEFYNHKCEWGDGNMHNIINMFPDYDFKPFRAEYILDDKKIWEHNMIGVPK
jgi:FkbM family methyltransferase